MADLQWWAGWTAAQTRRAVGGLGCVEVALDCGTAGVLPDDLEREEAPEPWVALLPALDPTAMGWTDRSSGAGRTAAAALASAFDGRVGDTELATAVADPWAVVPVGGKYPSAKRLCCGDSLRAQRRQTSVPGHQDPHPPRQLGHRKHPYVEGQSQQGTHQGRSIFGAERAKKGAPVRPSGALAQACVIQVGRRKDLTPYGVPQRPIRPRHPVPDEVVIDQDGQ